MAAVLHERWFVPYSDLPTRWGDMARPGVALAVGASAAVVLAVTLAWRRRDGKPLIPGPLALGTTPENLALLLGWVPFVLALHTAVPLFVSGVRGELFVPSLLMERPVSLFVGLAEVGIGLLLYYGLLTRAAAFGIGILWATGVALFGPVLLLEQAIFLGIAGFFYIASRGPLAVDRVFGPRARPLTRLLPLAVPLLRMGAGVSIAWLALTEKLLNLPLGLRFIDRYPWVNFVPALGVPLSDESFLMAAGAVELTGGLLLAIGAFPRVVILLLWLPFNLTLTAFGWQELVGHLPVYAVMGIVLLWGSGGREDVIALRRGLEPDDPGSEGVGRGVPARPGAAGPPPPR